MKIWQNSKTAKFLIGEPIKLKYVKIFDRSTYLGDSKATFFIPFSGKNYNGKMNVDATMPDSDWILNELSLELDGDLKDKKFIVYRKKTSADSKDDHRTDDESMNGKFRHVCVLKNDF